MKKSPITPFVLIMVLGIVLIFILSFKGLEDSKQVAKGGEEPKQTATKPEDLYQQQGCINCHGQNYEGGAGPALKGVGDRLSHDQIKDVLINGRGTMPQGLVPADKADAMADWLAKIK